jgi:HD superfamily phosphohydrolase
MAKEDSEENKPKLIFDLVHGYIKLTPNVIEVINKDSFQRLKSISQMPVNHLYPSANHTRFEHSLGVMKLAMDFFEQIQAKENFNCLCNKNGKTVKKEFHEFHLKYAALLHDIGHAPLSHIGEVFYEKKEIKSRIREYGDNNGYGISTDLLNVDDDGDGVAEHEWMSCLVVLKKLGALLSKIYKDEVGVESGPIDFDYLMRIITGKKYSNHEEDRNIIISILNSETIDVDKIDYLMRDNLMTGGNIGQQIDMEKLLESLRISDKDNFSDEGNSIVFDQRGLSAIQNIIECRDNLYIWVNNHHTAVYTEFLIEDSIRHLVRDLPDYKKVESDPPEYINMARLMNLVKKSGNSDHYKDKKNEEILAFCEEGRLDDYSDFARVKENIEKSKTEKPKLKNLLNEMKYFEFEERSTHDRFFSCDAIVDNLMTDHDIYTLLLNAKRLADKKESTLYIKILLRQLFEREHLKPVWKTLHDFKEFLKSNKGYINAEKTIEYIKDESNRKEIINKICKDTKCLKGQVLLIVLKNKFYTSDALNKIQICYKKSHPNAAMGIKSVTKFIPPRNYEKFYDKVAFYLYCKKEKEPDVVKSFIKFMSKVAPPEEAAPRPKPSAYPP